MVYASKASKTSNPLRRGLLATGFVLACFGLAQAQTYIWTDPATGSKVYSNDPPPPAIKKVQSKNLHGNTVTTSELPFSVQEAMRLNPVSLYSTDCAPCTLAIKLLAKRGIPYTLKNPATDDKAANELTKLVGGLEIPTLTVGTKTLKFFEEGAWNAALDSAGYPKTNVSGLKGTGEQKVTPPPQPKK